ncbi:PP2C family protein-serine/threonine phosphatase [Streptomyces salinarius]|uniref:PP2C family protein-serine/threonine phosphatase n=1 Tax=Streptomyces salinarius TaxID=2762598 RepID=UPI0016460834|nr:PP2C family protein-serine/threonine phosphatase [Streptomyces salinarius]
MRSVFSVGDVRFPGPRGLGSTLLLISEDEEEASAVRRMLPRELADVWIWCRTTAEAAPLLALRRAPMCVLVGRSHSGVKPAEVAARVRQLASDVPAVVVAHDAVSAMPPAAVWRPGPGRPDPARADRRTLGQTVRLAMERQHMERFRVETGSILSYDSISLERGLLPAPTLRGDAFTAVSRYEPGRSHALLSGDFYDVVQTEDSRVHVILGDVSGHGPAEAALAVQLRVAWRTAVLCGTTQLAQLEVLERILTAERSDDDTYATVVSLVFPPEATSATVVNAGHPGMLHRRSGQVRWVEPPRTGMALGLFPGLGDWSVTEMELAPHDSVVLFTDGLFEGRTERSARLGEEGLLRLATRHAHLGSQEFVDALVAGATSMAAPYGGLVDDVAVLHLGWNQNPSLS